MTDQPKSNPELIAEINTLRRQLEKSEERDRQHQQAEQVLKNAHDQMLQRLNDLMTTNIQLQQHIQQHKIKTGIPEAEKTVFTVLTVKEREVLQQIAEGNSTKKIALKFKVSDKAIEATRRRIMVKLDIDNVAELTKYAIREGITTLEF